ncbi:hypothetical protein F5Y15DRAFT_251518 [Xylariaceae sp. FL0016]|nr:hypothetical protein F5Y15DRAFT_251518 [Xylariaceae sp. FL0016]
MYLNPLYTVSEAHPTSPETTAAVFEDSRRPGQSSERIVHVNIASTPDAASWFPYDNPAVVSVLEEDYHPKFPEIYIFRYIDLFGQPAIMPTMAYANMASYFAPLEKYERWPLPPSPYHAQEAALSGQHDPASGSGAAEVRHGARDGAGHVDSILRKVRTWSCWSQGFRFLEMEIRWLLTVVFDAVNLAIAWQCAGRYGAEHPMFWKARYVVHELIYLVMDLVKEFNIPNFGQPPEVNWFAEEG